jgi:hypothetical protein
VPGRKLPYSPRKAEFVWTQSGEVPRPVFGIDADGTLGEFHAHFFNFAAQYLGIPEPATYDGKVTMAEHLGVSKRTYREVKLHFRLSGLKRAMPVLSGARSLCVSLRMRGAEVIICTTRPFLKVDGIEQDTREWLRRHCIPHDGVIHGEHKYRELRRRAGEGRIVAVLDDLPEMVEQAEKIGLPTLLLRRPHNEHYVASRNPSDLRTAALLMLGMLEEWEKKVWNSRAHQFLQLSLPLPKQS